MKLPVILLELLNKITKVKLVKIVCVKIYIKK